MARISYYHHRLLRSALYNNNPSVFPILPAKTRASFSSAVSFVGSEFCLSVGTHLIPHPDKVDKGGEDAFLVSKHKGGVIAVADGVSGWAEKNVDPALFPQELMANAYQFAADEEVNYDPQMLIKKAHAATSSMGSATIIVAMLEKNGKLKIANVGDCGLRIIRKGQVVFSTRPQEHYFDCPYQLSSETIGQTYRDATVCSVELMEGDTVIMATDGLFDNIFEYEIVDIISNFKDANEELAYLARSHSLDVKFDSPYAVEARSRGFDVPSWKRFLGMKLTGGKLDDITVIVAKVVRSLDKIKDDKHAEKENSIS